MRKLTYFLLAVLVTVLIYSCADDNALPEPFDHAAQAVIDNDLLLDFLNKNYYDQDLDSVRPLVDGKIPLSKDTILKSQDIVEQGVNYRLFYYKKNKDSVMVSTSPAVTDSVFIKYRGKRIVNSNSSITFETKGPVWFDLNTTIRGVAYGFTHFEDGINDTQDNEPITYKNTGKGVLFIPSGLAYRNVAVTTKIPANSNLIYYIDLWDVKE